MLVQHYVVRLGPWSRGGPFLEALGLGVEDPNLIGAEFSKPPAVLGVHVAPARGGTGSRRIVELDFQGLGIDPSDLLRVNVVEIEVVMGVGPEAVNGMASTILNIQVRVDSLNLAGSDI